MEAQNKYTLSRKQVNILNIKVDSTSRGELLTNIGQKVASGDQIYIVTPNPEIALQAQNDELLAEIINKADFSVPDGTGLKLARWNVPIIHGRMLAEDLLNMARAVNMKVFLVGGTPKGTRKAVEKLKNKFSGLQIYGEYGPKLNLQGEPDTEVDSKVNNDLVKRINSVKPDFLFVGFGAPRQEKWIWKNKASLKVDCLMTVGGAIDYWAGTTKLPPKWVETLELEWLWRVLMSPSRLGRVIKAVFVFPLKLIFSK